MNQKIEITNNWNIQKVFNELENWNMKIPRFQRGYVWERSKIVKLLNSIYEEHPIGSFFIWEASAQYADFCREIKELGLPKKPDANKFKFIIDGQQRITSLYVALMGKQLKTIDYGVICFNLDKRRFQIPKLKTESNNIPAWKIFNQQEILTLIAQYALADAQNGTEYCKTLQQCKYILDNYPISLIKTLDVELDEAVAIFENINQGGKRLSLFDLVHASVWAKDFDLRSLIQEFNDETKIKLFGGLQMETFTQALSLNAKDNCLQVAQLNLKCEECKKIWDRTLECLRLAIDFVKGYGVQHTSILPYDAMLAVLQYYFFKSKKNSIDNVHKQFINDWFWTTTFSKRYSSSALTHEKEDADWIALLVNEQPSSRTFGITISLDELKRIQMKNASVVKNGILCILAANNPLDFNNGEQVKLDNTNASRANAKENHHFFPYSRQKDCNITQKEVNSLLNFAFISKNLNLEISNKLPSTYLQSYVVTNPKLKEMLLTHFIDEAAYECAMKNNFKGFVEARGRLILNKINELCKTGRATIAINTEEDEYDTSDDLESDFVSE